MANDTKGFTGRDLSKMINAMYGKKMSSPDHKISPEEIQRVAKRFIEERNQPS